MQRFTDQISDWQEERGVTDKTMAEEFQNEM